MDGVSTYRSVEANYASYSLLAEELCIIEDSEGAI